jgi:hypothetical protein
MKESKGNAREGIKIIRFLIICLTAWNLLRMGMTISFWKTLSSYDAYSIYIFLTGGVWLLIGLALLVILKKRESYSHLAIMSAAVGYSVWYWLDRLFIQKPHMNWPFSLTLNIFILTFVTIILFSRRSGQDLQRNSYERKPKTKPTA